MLSTLHRVFYADSRELGVLPDRSIDLVLTSPPYPMIEMWDSVFGRLNHRIGEALLASNGRLAFELMHRELDKVWRHVYRVLRPGGWACISIGDATRKIGNRFQLFSNHSRITSALFDLGLDCRVVHDPTEGYRAFYDERYHIEGDPAPRPVCGHGQKET